MINQVALTGRLTKDIELKYTQSGNAVASFILAVNRRFVNQQGQRETDFINCVLWRKNAENLANFAHKGSLIGIEGSLQTRSYIDSDNKKIYITEVLCNAFTLLETKTQSNEQVTSKNQEILEMQPNDLPF